jgi:hypothetical protein
MQMSYKSQSRFVVDANALALQSQDMKTTTEKIKTLWHYWVPKVAFILHLKYF